MPAKSRGRFAWCEHGGVKRIEWQVEELFRHQFDADRGTYSATPLGAVVMVPCKLGTHYLMPDPTDPGHIIEVTSNNASPPFLWPGRATAEAALRHYEQQQAEEDRQLGLE